MHLKGFRGLFWATVRVYRAESQEGHLLRRVFVKGNTVYIFGRSATLHIVSSV